MFIFHWVLVFYICIASELSVGHQKPSSRLGVPQSFDGGHQWPQINIWQPKDFFERENHINACPLSEMGKSWKGFFVWKQWVSFTKGWSCYGLLDWAWSNGPKSHPTASFVSIDGLHRTPKRLLGFWHPANKLGAMVWRSIILVS